MRDDIDARVAAILEGWMIGTAYACQVYCGRASLTPRGLETLIACGYVLAEIEEPKPTRKARLRRKPKKNT